jgi:hypothetical protein
MRYFSFRMTRIIFLLEEKRSEVNQVIAPDHPSVEAGSFDRRDGHVLRLEEGNELAVGVDE